VSFSEEHVCEARAGLMRLYTALRDAPPAAGGVDWSEPNAQSFAAAMDDDFNTAEAVGVLFALANEVNRGKSADLARQLKGLGGVLGLLQREPMDFLRGGEGDDAAQIDALIERRAAAKKERNFAEADRIRAELAEQGIVLEDSATGTTWRRQ
jgi:cysteinyl-tRNA synthetase